MHLLNEAEHFQHIHVHVVPRPSDLPDELKGPRIFALLKAVPEDAVPPDEIRRVCADLSARFRSDPPPRP